MHVNASLTLYIIISSNLSNYDCQVSSLTQDHRCHSIILRNIFAGNKIEYCVILNVLNFLACSRHSDTCSGRQREVREWEKNKEEDRGRGEEEETRSPPTPPHHCFFLITSPCSCAINLNTWNRLLVFFMLLKLIGAPF